MNAGSESRLALGTAQLGTDYGIANTAGKPTRREAAELLRVAESAGIRLLDTAPAYGDSEEVIGASRPAGAQFDVISKTPVSIGEASVSDVAERIVDAAAQSVRQTGGRSLYGLLVHHGDVLVGSAGSAITETLERLREDGVTRKIGVSVYSPKELERILAFWTPDIVQLPLNLLDQRMARSGMLEKLDQANVEIHVRSVFLQGVLLTPPEELSEFFAPVGSALQRIARKAEALGLSRIQLCLAAGLVHSKARVIVGVSRAREIENIIEAVATLPSDLPDIQDLAIEDVRFLEPFQWTVGRGAPRSLPISTVRSFVR